MTKEFVFIAISSEVGVPGDHRTYKSIITVKTGLSLTRLKNNYAKGRKCLM